MSANPEKEFLICTNEFCLEDGRDNAKRTFVGELAEMNNVAPSRFQGPHDIPIGTHTVSTRESCGRCLAACGLRPAAVAIYQSRTTTRSGRPHSARHDVTLGETSTAETLQGVARFFDAQTGR